MSVYRAAIYFLVMAANVARAEPLRWPSDGEHPGGESTAARLDGRVRFEDGPPAPHASASHRASGDVAFVPASDTAGFYNRPAAARIPVLSRAAPHTEELAGALSCRCEAGERPCCSTQLQPPPRHADARNEIGDMRSLDVLVGPGGPTGNGGLPILVGPQGSTGVIGPLLENTKNELEERESAQRGYFIPGSSSGFITSGYQRPVLVGPGGPTGAVGPRRQRVLVGPGGPTGVIGPFGVNRGYGPTNRGVLVGPGGPTGAIGPGRRILVGPGGPSGQIGPRGSFGR